MQIINSDSYEEISQRARTLIIEEISNRKDLLLCASTGSSPTRTYELLADEYQDNPELFSQLRVIKLDEWGNVLMDDPETCESYLQQHLIQPLHIPDSRYISEKIQQFNLHPSIKLCLILSKLLFFTKVNLSSRLNPKVIL